MHGVISFSKQQLFATTPVSKHYRCLESTYMYYEYGFAIH